MFSKKATKLDEIFTVYLTLCTYVVSVKSLVKILSISVAFLENINFISFTRIPIEFLVEIHVKVLKILSEVLSRIS